MRDPLVALDIRGQIASLNPAAAARGAVPGVGRSHREVRDAAPIAHAREKLAARLAELPDGEWREVQYIDHDGHAPKIYKILCTMTRRGAG